MSSLLAVNHFVGGRALTEEGSGLCLFFCVILSLINTDVMSAYVSGPTGEIYCDFCWWLLEYLNAWLRTTCKLRACKGCDIEIMSPFTRRSQLFSSHPSIIGGYKATSHSSQWKFIKSHRYLETYYGVSRFTRKELILVMQHFITVTKQIAVTSDILYVTLGIANALFSVVLN